MRNSRLERVLSKNNNWSTLHVIFEGDIVKTGFNCGRQMVVKLDGEYYLICEGQFKIHTSMHFTEEEIKEVLATIEEF